MTCSTGISYAPFFAALAVEGAELAGEGADVGVIDVAVAVVERLFGWGGGGGGAANSGTFVEG